MHDSITTILGDYPGEDLFFYLKAYKGIGDDEIAHHLNDLSAILTKRHGTQGRAIANAIMRHLYVRLSLDFIETGNHCILDYMFGALERLVPRGLMAAYLGGASRV